MPDLTDTQALSLAEFAYRAACDDAAERGHTATEVHRHGLLAVVSSVRTMLVERPAPVPARAHADRCPTCQGRSRTTVGMVCMTCGTDYAMEAAPCRAEYERPGGRERGDRIVRCGQPAGHPGEHEEAETEVTWCDQPTPAEFAALDTAVVAGRIPFDRRRDPYAEAIAEAERHAASGLPDAMEWARRASWLRRRAEAGTVTG